MSQIDAKMQKILELDSKIFYLEENRNQKTLEKT